MKVHGVRMVAGGVAWCVTGQEDNQTAHAFHLRGGAHGRSLALQAGFRDSKSCAFGPPDVIDVVSESRAARMAKHLLHPASTFTPLPPRETRALSPSGAIRGIASGLPGPRCGPPCAWRRQSVAPGAESGPRRREP